MSNRKLKFDLEKNSIVCGDCEEWLKFIPDKSVDLIYIDPPFFSNKNYEIIWGNGFEMRSFGDRWSGEVNHYIDWMRPKIQEAKRVLKDTGSIFLHCDWHASHRLRVMLDEVFHEKNFVNEIIWHYRRWSNSSKNFQRMHDTIFWYCETNQYFNNIPNQPYSNENYIEDTVRKVENGKLKRIKDSNGNYVKRKKQNNGVPMHDVFHDINFIAPTSKERIGYRTQKPEDLIKRIIECSTKEGDMILDFFGGGGTTAKVSADLKRKFIIGDVSPVAIRVTADRLISHGYYDYEIKSLPSTKEEWLAMNSTEFEKRICEFQGYKHIGGPGNPDGITKGKNKKMIPVEIKNHSKNASESDINQLCRYMEKYKSKIGIFIAWGLKKTAYEYISILKKNSKNIHFIEVKEILGSILLPMKHRIKQQKLYEERVKNEKIQKIRLKAHKTG